MVSSASQIASVSATARSTGSFRFFVQNRAQQPPVNPLDDHVTPAALFAVVGLHHAGMVELLADLLLAPEALQQNRVGLHLRMRNLHRHLPSVAQIRRAVERGHAAARNLRIQAVVVQRVSGFKLGRHFVSIAISSLSCKS